jgi:hypothetical protein
MEACKLNPQILHYSGHSKHINFKFQLEAEGNLGIAKEIDVD